MSAFSDPLREARQKSGILKCPFHGEDITMLLRHEDVRQAAKDWQTFSSDAPFRVPIPSEEAVRTMRQLPIETNPPEHGDYRAIVEPFFARAKDPAVIAQVEALIADLLDQVLARNSVEIINEFALPVQSRALTHLLNVPASEGEIWLGWASTFSRSPAANSKPVPSSKTTCTANSTTRRPTPAPIFSARSRRPPTADGRSRATR